MQLLLFFIQKHFLNKKINILIYNKALDNIKKILCIVKLIISELYIYK